MKNSIINECWKPVAGYEGLYEVSDLGRVRTLSYRRTGEVKVLKFGMNSKGYYTVMLYNNGNPKRFLVHRVVVTAFIGDIPKGLTVDHINGIKTDNRLENLQVLSGADNTRKANNKQVNLMLAEHPFTKLTFSSSYEASAFFGYKKKGTVGDYIFYARKRGENFIKIRNEKYFFVQHQSAVQTALNKFSELTHN